ncbi:hypothetical protein ACP70R_015898 [Stipagrostis hirtigluma subsp. patula]
MARFLDRIILFVISLWSDIPDLQSNRNVDTYCKPRYASASPSGILAGSCHLTQSGNHDDDDATSPSQQEPRIG